MIVFPNCKINLGLHITGKREDGYHDIETVFYPLPIKDALEILPEITDQRDNHGINQSVREQTGDIIFTSGGMPIDGSPADNLCLKAYSLLKKDFPTLPAIRLHLYKAIPMGAGLGGGSADGAFMLLALNEKFELALSTQQLIAYALHLGSDCPFFIINQPCLGTGRGEKLVPVSLDLSSFQLVVVNPGIHVNTGWAFSQLSDRANGSFKKIRHRKPIPATITEPVETWKDELANEFEQPVFEKYPEIKAIRETLYANGAVYASMSGSGSSVYGLFYKNVKPYMDFPASYLLKRVLL